jgi:hypothetical protein
MRGHLRERSPGHWAIVIDVRDPQTGTRRRRWHSFAGTKRQAQVEAARLISASQTGVLINPSRMTVEAYLDRFESDWVAVHVSARTAERYGQLLDHARRHLGDRKLQKLKPADLAAFYAALSRSGLAPRTISHVHSVVFQALRQAKIWGVIRDNVAEAGETPAGAGSGTADLTARSRAGIARSPARPSVLLNCRARAGDRHAAQ